MKPEFHPAAEEELSNATEWYETRVPGLGVQMRDEVFRAIALLCARPSIGIPAGASLRRLHLRRFPYTLMYRVSGDNLRIIAVAHKRRRPGFWSLRE